MKTLMVAHRGWSSLETENTMAAFKKAATNKYFSAIECDIHVTSDGYFIVHHDDTTQRLGDVNILLRDHTLKEVQDIKLRNLKTNEFDTNYRIPLLEEYLLLCKENNLIPIIELKPEFTVNQVERLLKLVSDFDMLDVVCFISFNLKNLILLRGANKVVKMQLLLDYFTEELVSICNVLEMGLNFRRDIPTKELIAKLHANNIKVNAWTVNFDIDKERLISDKIDFITTDNLNEKNEENWS